MQVRILFQQDEQGSALILTLLILMVMSILIISALELLSTDLQIIDNHLRDIQATYIADAGIEDAIYELTQNFNWSTGFTDKEFPSGSGSIYTVTVENNYPLVTITSTSTVSGIQRTIEAQVEVYGSTSPPYSVKVIYWKEL
jgi:Tfp pilus assembly protein PilX